MRRMLYMKSNGITQSKMIETGFEGLNSRFEPSTPPPPKKIGAQIFMNSIKMQCDTRYIRNLMEL